MNGTTLRIWSKRNGNLRCPADRMPLVHTQSRGGRTSELGPEGRTSPMLMSDKLPQVVTKQAAQSLVNAGSPIDAFGVGTKLAVMEDASYLNMAYKLVEYGGKGRLKLSASKVLYPGRKQVFRQVEDGRMIGDVIGRFDEHLSGEPLLQPLMRGGLINTRIDLEESRRRFQHELSRLPDQFRKLHPSPAAYPVTFSNRLQLDLDIARKELAHGT